MSSYLVYWKIFKDICVSVYSIFYEHKEEKPKDDPKLYCVDDETGKVALKDQTNAYKAKYIYDTFEPPKVNKESIENYIREQKMSEEVIDVTPEVVQEEVNTVEPAAEEPVIEERSHEHTNVLLTLDAFVDAVVVHAEMLEKKSELHTRTGKTVDRALNQVASALAALRDK